jgi:hypothetical protein
MQGFILQLERRGASKCRVSSQPREREKEPVSAEFLAAEERE